MATISIRRMAVGAAVLMSTLALSAISPSPASACSFAPGKVTIEGQPTAGGTLRVHGAGFFAIDGYLDGMCQGDYQFVAAAPITVIVRFETLSGPRAQAVTATVVGEPTAPDDYSQESFTFDLEVPIPADATEVTVEAGYPTATADVTGAVATTVPPTSPPATPPSTGTGNEAVPATPVSGQANLTG